MFGGRQNKQKRDWRLTTAHCRATPDTYESQLAYSATTDAKGASDLECSWIPRKRVISTFRPSAAAFVRDQCRTLPRFSCLIRDAASRPAADQPRERRAPWAFMRAARQFVACPSSYRNRLESICRLPAALRVATGGHRSSLPRTCLCIMVRSSNSQASHKAMV